jgi:hypothetical protein
MNNNKKKSVTKSSVTKGKSTKDMSAKDLAQSIDRVLTIREKKRTRTQFEPYPLDRSQIGAVVKTRLTQLGIGDLKKLTIAYPMGYTFVGNGTDGTNNSVYFQTASGTYLIAGTGSAISGTLPSGAVPIAPSDGDLGASYVTDIFKHFSRVRINRLQVHVDSLQPSTSNNMVAVVGPSRGPGLGQFSYAVALATGSIQSNSYGQVSSMQGAFAVDSWESKCVDLTRYIAGGSGPLQNEFEISTIGTAEKIYPTAEPPQGPLLGLVPACLTIAGNSTTAGLAGTRVHQISISFEVDLLDFLGGIPQPYPLG